MKRFALASAALLVTAPAAAQVATIPAPAIPVKSLALGWGSDVKTSVSVTLYGYTAKSQIPQLLTKQTATIPPASLLSTQFSVEFPADSTTSVTLMQMVIKTTSDAPTFQAKSETVTPKKPLAVQVPAGKKVWAVYNAPLGKEATVRFYVGTPPPAAPSDTPSANGTTVPPATRIVADSLSVWTLGAVTSGTRHQILRNGVVIGNHAEKLEKSPKGIHAYNTADGYTRWDGSKWIKDGP
jgi:hypothetical protein